MLSGVEDNDNIWILDYATYTPTAGQDSILSKRRRKSSRHMFHSCIPYIMIGIVCLH